MSTRAVAFDVDTASLAGLREALPGWEIDCVLVGAVLEAGAHSCLLLPLDPGK